MIPGDHTNPVEDNAPARDPAAPAPEGAEQRARLVSRRALVRAGWIVPVVLAVHLPPNALAQAASCAHADVAAAAHVDISNDPHADTPATAHVDSCV